MSEASNVVLTPEQRTARQCGRLLAVLQHIQDTAAKNVGSRYVSSYGAASTRPASVLVAMHRRALQRLKQVRRDVGVGAAINLGKLLEQVHEPIKDGIPTSLSLEGQGQFQLGYYHQLAEFYQDVSRNAGKADQDEGPDNEPPAV